ncbi:MAG: ATP-binding domain-containing protein [Candidatus Omnitrophica bacterium]|nr:ATP-binding domain-containing protein [Candidatus Omnitrophota bacterium]
MTALRAKGKEFDVVIVLDCNSGVWPSKLAVGEDQLEAERRLFYVAVTRTRKRLILLVDDKMFGDQAMPSPYLSEMGLTSVPA